MKKFKAYVILFLVAFGVVFSCVWCSLDAKALPAEKSSIAEKIYYRDLFLCYQSSDWLKDSIAVSDFSGILEGLVKGDKGIDSVEQPYMGEMNKKVGCGTIITSKVENNFSSGYRMTQDVATLKERLEKAYYKYSGGSRVDGNSSGRIHASYPLKWFEEKWVSAGFLNTKAEWMTVNNGLSYTFDLYVGGDKTTGYTFSTADCGESCSDVPISFGKFSLNSLTITKAGVNQWFCSSEECDLKKTEKTLDDFSGYDSKEKVLEAIGNEIAVILGSTREKSTYKNQSSPTKKVTYMSACGAWHLGENKIVCENGSGTFDVNFNDNSSSAVYTKKFDNDLYSFFSNGKYNAESVKFSELEIYVLYQSYLQDIYGVNSKLCFDSPQYGKGDDYTRLYSAEAGRYQKYCYFDVKEDKRSIEVNGVYDNHYWGKTPVDLKGVLDTLFNLSVEEAPDKLIEESGAEDEGQEEPYEQEVCYDQSGAMGWVICPVITLASKVGESFYDSIEEKFLEIPALDIFSEKDGVNEAWRKVRDIANIAFVILFLVVIFSQLTGIGIDNYGIKKILPKLIVMAILVNLSLIICELVVDLSNIFGNGLEKILEDNAPQAVVGGMNGESVYASGAVTFALGGGAAVLFAWLQQGSLAGAAGYLGLAALGIVIMVIVAIVFLYLILVARQAGVVICIVLAPVAIVLYALPNTEKIAKKWLDLFKALLFVYPICGLMVGGGKFAGAILANISSDMRVAAMIVQVLPYFLVPLVLKNSLALAGNIGARLSTLGRNIGRRGAGGLRSAIQGTDRYKDWQQYNREKDAYNRARRTERGLKWLSRGDRSKLSARDQDRLLKAEQTQTAWQQRQAQAKVGAYTPDSEIMESRAQSAKDTAEQKAYLDQFAGFDRNELKRQAGYDEKTGSYGGVSWINQPGGAQRMSALIKTMEANGMEKEIFPMLRQNSSVGNISSVMQTLAGSNNKVLRAYGKNGFGKSYADFVSQGGLQSYINKKGTDFIDGLDDKALKEIALNNPTAMSTDMLMATAARINSQDAVDQIDAMIKNRNGIDIKFSGEQLSKFNYSTVKELINKAQTDSDVQNMLIKASDDMAKDTKLLNSLTEPNRREINEFRNRMGQANI